MRVDPVFGTVVHVVGSRQGRPTLGGQQARRVIELWTERTRALGRRPDVDQVVVFENRGRGVGATIAHPHGQIYAYDHVPNRQARRVAGGWRPDLDSGERLVTAADGWVAWVPYASKFPLAIEIDPTEPHADLMALGERRGAWPTCWSTCSAGSTGCSGSRLPT